MCNAANIYTHDILRTYYNILEPYGMYIRTYNAISSVTIYMRNIYVI